MFETFLQALLVKKIGATFELKSKNRHILIKLENKYIFIQL